MTVIRSKARQATMIQWKLQTFPVSFVTCSEVSAQKGTELTKHLSQLLFLLNLLTADIYVQLPDMPREREREKKTGCSQELASEFHNMPDLISVQFSVPVSRTKK